MSDQPRQLAHSTLSVTTASQAAAAANLQRTYLLLINDSANAIYVKFGAAAVLNDGIRLNANGGSAEFSMRNGNLDTRVVNAITTPTAQLLLITEA